MLVFDDSANPLILDSIHVPTIADYFWVLDLNLMDFTMAPLLVFEEINCSTIQIQIQGFEFLLPSNWNMLVYDQETYQIDTVTVANLAGKEFTAMIYGPKLNAVYPGKVTVMDYKPLHCHVVPSLNKHQMLCHPIGADVWINVAPSDGYNKYLKEKFVGDLI